MSLESLCCQLSCYSNNQFYFAWYVSAPGRNDEDELYETYIIETNRVYRLVDDKLHLVEEYSGSVLKYGMLRSKEVS